MKRSNELRFTASLLALAISGAALAQQPQTNFPSEQVKPSTCADFQWNADMLREHPRVVDACQEVVVAGGTHWARLSAKFVRVESDGVVSFRVHDQRDRFIEEVTMQPAPGQVAYINDRATPFDRLRTTDVVNLYAPEGQYGFATQAGAPREQVAVWRPAPAPVQPATPAVAVQPAPAVAYVESPRAMLPRTAGPLPLVALAGLLSLMGALGLALRRTL